MVTVVEANAADDGGFLDGDGGKKLGDCHCPLRDGAAKYGAVDKVHFDLFLFDSSYSKIRVGFGVYLPQVDLTIFLGKEANEMGPIRRHDGKR